MTTYISASAPRAVLASRIDTLVREAHWLRSILDRVTGHRAAVRAVVPVLTAGQEQFIDALAARSAERVSGALVLPFRRHQAEEETERIPRAVDAEVAVIAERLSARLQGRDDDETVEVVVQPPAPGTVAAMRRLARRVTGTRGEREG